MAAARDALRNAIMYFIELEVNQGRENAHNHDSGLAPRLRAHASHFPDALF
jgi:hypothetical protein